MHGQYNLLFLCTGNSARSIMAESVTNGMHDKRIHAFSAGSRPSGTVHPVALDLLTTLRLPVRACGARAGTSSPGPALRSWT